MAWIELDLDCYTFEGVDGEIHTFPGCSLVGFFEFESRLQDLQLMLLGAASEMPVQALYLSDRRFRWTVDRCLKLNGIDPTWCNWQIVEQLLFTPGLLLQVNTPKSNGDGGTGEPAQMAELIAGIAQATGSISEAIELAKNHPLNAIVEIVEAYTKAQLPPEEQQKQDFEQWKQKRQAEAFGIEV
jgi:hypothetical protein